MGSGQTVARMTAGGEEGSAGEEPVSAGERKAPGRAVGAKAGADVTQGAGEEPGAARCEEIQEPVLASAGGGTRSSLVAGEIPMKHRKNCECCHHHSLIKGHNVNVDIVVLNCQK